MYEGNNLKPAADDDGQRSPADERVGGGIVADDDGPRRSADNTVDADDTSSATHGSPG